MFWFFRYFLCLILRLVDSDYYLENYEDVKSSSLSPIYHFSRYGIREFRNPNKYIDCKTAYVLLQNIFFLSNFYKLLFYRILIRFNYNFDIDPLDLTILLTKNKYNFFFHFKKTVELRLSTILLFNFLLSGRKISFENSSNPIIDIIIVSWNKPHFSYTLLQNLRKQKLINSRIIIIDNGSNILTRKFLSKIFVLDFVL
jgi:hypothetical protein